MQRRSGRWRLAHARWPDRHRGVPCTCSPPHDPPCTFFDDGWALHPSVACSRSVRPDFFSSHEHTCTVAFRSVWRACSRSLARCDKLHVLYGAGAPAERRRAV